MSKPDPRLAFTPRNSAKSLDLLVDALKKRAGIVVLSGENGVGKSTTLRKFVLRQREAGHAMFMPEQPTLSMDALLEAVCDEGGIKTTGSDRLSHLYALRDHLEMRLKSGDVCTIIADNGAGAPDAMLRDLGLLADLERNSPRPIQIVLSGTSRLIDRLNTPEFNTIRKEVGAVIKLEPFERDETGAYLQHCLTIAGYRGPSLFSFSAVERIHAKTRGVPRAINQVAVSALAALKTSGGKLSPETIDIAVAEALAAPSAEAPAPAPIVAPPAPVVLTLPVAPPPSEIVMTPSGGGLMSQPQTMTVRMMLDKLDREFSSAKPAPVPEQFAAAEPPPPAAPRAEIDRVIADAAGSIAASEPAPPTAAIAEPAAPEIHTLPADTAAQAADPSEKPAPSAADLVADALALVDAEEAQNTVRVAAERVVAPSPPAPAPVWPAAAAPRQTDSRPHNSARQRLLSRLTGR